MRGWECVGAHERGAHERPLVLVDSMPLHVQLNVHS